MAEKLIPGIPHATRIAILQQTDGEYEAGGTGAPKLDKSVLESVLSSDESWNDAVRTADSKYAIRLGIGIGIDLYCSSLEELRDRRPSGASARNSQNSTPAGRENALSCPEKC